MAVSASRQTGDRRRCRFCDAHVSAALRRTYGDDARRAHRCTDCDSWPRIVAGSARGEPVEIPDPQENPERSAGRWSA